MYHGRVSIVMNLEKADRVLTAAHCISILSGDIALYIISDELYLNISWRNIALIVVGLTVVN